jgi:hypothetical protein
VDVPGSSYSNPYAINSAGDVVGFFLDAAGSHGFVLSKGVYTTLDYPGAVPGTTGASGINDFGEVVGDYTDANGALHGFIATP